jgi:hypothetical protein
MVQLAATFGTPAALLIWMWQQSRQVQPRDEANGVEEKIDEMRDMLHSLDTRMSVVETILKEREGKPASRRT